MKNKEKYGIYWVLKFPGGAYLFDVGREFDIAGCNDSVILDGPAWSPVPFRSQATAYGSLGEAREACKDFDRPFSNGSPIRGIKVFKVSQKKRLSSVKTHHGKAQKRGT